jgi:hypothetical protein
MKRWAFSWRAIGAWLAASAIAGIVFGIAISLINQWATPAQRADFLSDAVAIGGLSAGAFAVIAGVTFLAGSFLRHMMPWPRPWVDAAIIAGCLLGLIAYGVNFSFETPLTQFQNTLLYVVLPFVCAVLIAAVYWRFASRRPGAAAGATPRT